MKIDFFFAWTKNKDRSDEYTKAVGGGLKFPPLLKWLKISDKKKKDRPEK